MDDGGGTAFESRGTPGFFSAALSAVGGFLLAPPTSPPLFWKQLKHEHPLGCTPPTITTSPEYTGALPMSATTKLPRPAPLAEPTLTGLRPLSGS